MEGDEDDNMEMDPPSEEKDEDDDDDESMEDNLSLPSFGELVQSIEEYQQRSQPIEEKQSFVYDPISHQWIEVVPKFKFNQQNEFMSYPGGNQTNYPTERYGNFPPHSFRNSNFHNSRGIIPRNEYGNQHGPAKKMGSVNLDGNLNQSRPPFIRQPRSPFGPMTRSKALQHKKSVDPMDLDHTQRRPGQKEDDDDDISDLDEDILLNGKQAFSPSEALLEKYPELSDAEQSQCCITGCNNGICHRQFKSIKIKVNVKEGYREQKWMSICDSCYYRDRYKYNKFIQKRRSEKLRKNYPGFNNETGSSGPGFSVKGKKPQQKRHIVTRSGRRIYTGNKKKKEGDKDEVMKDKKSNNDGVMRMHSTGAPSQQISRDYLRFQKRNLQIRMQQQNQGHSHLQRFQLPSNRFQQMERGRGRGRGRGQFPPQRVQNQTQNSINNTLPTRIPPNQNNGMIFFQNQNQNQNQNMNQNQNRNSRGGRFTYNVQQGQLERANVQNTGQNLLPNINHNINFLHNNQRRPQQQQQRQLPHQQQQNQGIMRPGFSTAPELRGYFQNQQHQGRKDDDDDDKMDLD